LNVKMIVTDLDRTLLRTDKTISAYTIDVLARYHKHGTKIAFATARSKRAIESFCEKIPTDALIVHNGAVVYIDGEVHTSFGIKPETGNDLLRSFTRDFPDLTISAEIDETLYANFDVSEVWHDTAFIRTDFSDIPNKLSDRIVIGSSEPLDMKRLAKYIPAELYIEESASEVAHMAMIMNRNATKWDALKVVAMEFGIPTDDIVVFGDDYNDILMVKGCGIGVAVENAIDEVKAVSNHICGANDNDGVAKWLEENLQLSCKFDRIPQTTN